MRVIIPAALFLLLATGCRTKAKIPSHVLSKPEMQAVLWDLVRSDEWLKDYVFNMDSSLDRRSESLKLYENVFRIHHIGMKKFKESFAWYRSHPDFLKIVLDSIDAKGQNLPPEIPKPPMIKDSLHNLRNPLSGQQG